MTVRRVGQSVLVGSLLAVTLGLAGCSGSGDAPATPSAAASGTSAPRPSDAGREGDPASVSATDICAALKEARPAVRAADTRTDRRAAISSRLSQVYGAKGLSGQMKPATVDSVSKQACPKVRTALLRSAKLKSLSDI